LSHLERVKDEYFFAASDYYAAGRFAFWTKLSSISGNLFHHAIELFLKGHLLLTMTPDELQNKFRHNLPRIWKHFKAMVPDGTLQRYDRTIADIHTFEAIRYPEDVITKGARFQLEVARRDLERNIKRKTSVTGGLPRYTFALEEVDALVILLFTVCSRNPDFFLRGRVPEETRLKYLAQANAAWHP
jgi:hypothetical protein